jgi:hypothetical protein
MRQIKIIAIGILFTQFSCWGFSQTNNQKIWEGFGQNLPLDIPCVFAPGIISTRDFEFAITFSPQIDELFFTRRKQGEENKIYNMKYINGKWTDPVIAFFSGKYMDMEPHIAPTGKRLYFGSKRPLERAKQLEFHQWYLDKLSQGWSEPKSLESPFKERPVMYISSTNDETLFFTVIRSGIYYSRKNNNNYDSISRLGKTINNGDFVAHPYIAPDGSYLIYDCVRKDGFGSCDLYISFKKENGDWSNSINLGNLINTDQCEMCASVSPDGNYLFFHRGNDKDIGDIYWVNFKRIKELKEKINGN